MIVVALVSVIKTGCADAYPGTSSGNRSSTNVLATMAWSSKSLRSGMTTRWSPSMRPIVQGW